MTQHLMDIIQNILNWMDIIQNILIVILAIRIELLRHKR